VSVVTPTLNRAELLERTLKSVRAQTYPRVEHIVVDGGSTDGTASMLADYAQTYDLSWVSEPDSGMYSALNKGLSRAHGEILAYVNSDDLYFPWTIEVVAEAFGKHPEADFIFGDALNVADDTGRLRVRWQAPFDLDTVERVGFLTQPAVFWRRRAMDAVGPFDESLRYVADCDYWMKAGARHRFVKVDEFLAIERDHPDTLRATQSPSMDRELRAVRGKYVLMRGPMHHVRSARDLARLVVLRRLYWLAFTLQARRPSQRRRPAWSRLLSTGRIRIRLLPALLQHLPGAGLPLRDRILVPDRTWLEPGD
jgi:glycosyltransferase involved in cell wall biosynthesis